MGQVCALIEYNDLMQLAVRAVVCLGLSLVATGCQSEKEGVDVICKGMPDSMQRDVEPAMRQKAYSEYLLDRVKNSDARGILNAMADMAQHERTQYLASAAERLGIGRCPMVAASEISRTLNDLSTSLSTFFASYRSEFEKEPKMVSALSSSCMDLESLDIASSRGREFAVAELESVQTAIEACFATLLQSATNAGFGDRYAKLAPASVLYKAASSHVAALSFVDGLDP